MNNTKLVLFLFIFSIVSSKLWGSQSALIYHSDTRSVSPVYTVLESAESDDFLSKWAGSNLGLSRSKDAISGDYSLNWRHRVDDVLVFALDDQDLSQFGSLSFYFKGAESSHSTLYVALREESGELWIQKNRTTITKEFSQVLIPLDEEAFYLDFDSKSDYPKLNFDSIKDILFLAQLQTASEELFLDDLALYDAPVSRVRSQRLQSQVSTEVKEHLSADVRYSLAPESDTTSANITTFLMDGKSVAEGDYVESLPNISAEVFDLESGIATWSITIYNADNDSEVDSHEGFSNLSTENVVELSFDIENELDSGDYYAVLEVLNGNALLATERSEMFTVQSAFVLSDALSGPNPFNPNNESANIQYHLSKHADVDIHIYSISGEEIWKKSINSGDVNGASAGFNSVEWSGKNMYGETVANGVYIGYLICKRGSEKKVSKIKIMVLK